MNMYQILKEDGTIITYCDAWIELSSNKFNARLVVYQRKYRQRITRELYRGDDQQRALEALWSSQD